MKVKGKQAKEYRMQLVIKLRQEGRTQAQIAGVVGLSQSRVSDILRLHREKGDEGLVIKSPPGNAAGLSAEQLEDLKKVLQDEALASGFPTAGWTLVRISEAVQRKFGIRYSLEHIRRLMKKIGFTRQRPKTKDYRQQAEQVEQWQSHIAPALKKSRTGRL